MILIYWYLEDNDPVMVIFIINELFVFNFILIIKKAGNRSRSFSVDELLNKQLIIAAFVIFFSIISLISNLKNWLVSLIY